MSGGGLSEEEREALTLAFRHYAVASTPQSRAAELPRALATVERILAARAAAAPAPDDGLRAAVEAICADPDDTQWWEVVPYMDPPERDEVVEVQVVAVDRLRAALSASPEPRADSDGGVVERVADVLASWGVRSRHGEWSDREAQVGAARDVLAALSDAPTAAEDGEDERHG